MGECSMVGAKFALQYDDAADTDTAWATPTWKIVEGRLDVTVDQGRNNGSIATADDDFEYSVEGAKTAEVTFSIEKKRTIDATGTSDTYDDLKTAYAAGATVIFAVTDMPLTGLGTGVTARGLKGIFKVVGFTENGPVQDQATVDVIIRPCKYYLADGTQVKIEQNFTEVGT